MDIGAEEKSELIAAVGICAKINRGRCSPLAVSRAAHQLGPNAQSCADLSRPSGTKMLKCAYIASGRMAEAPVQIIGSVQRDITKLLVNFMEISGRGRFWLPGTAGNLKV